MSDNPRSVPYDTADYLKTPEDIFEYFVVSIEEMDDRLLHHVLDDCVRAAKRIMPEQMAGYKDCQEESTFKRFTSLIKAMGYEVYFRPKQAA
jgi:hypothetical protein